MYNISKKLISVLETKNINYCHWKSNLLLNEALSGYDDLDLLVDKCDVKRFEAILLELNFIEASNLNISFSAIKHFYGLDIETGNILHLHVYYQVKTGPSWTKSMRFDFENYILDNTCYHDSGMRIPEKHIELVIFIIRIMMKYSKVNEYILIEKEKKRTAKEIEYLQDNIDLKLVQSFLDKHFSEISLNDLNRYIQIINHGSFIQRFFTANILKIKLGRYKNISFLKELYNNFKQFVYRVFNKLVFKQKKKLHSSGALIVIAGLDATGKTTITTDLKRWLGKNFSVSLVHFGKPPSTFGSYPFNFLIRLLRKRSIKSDLRSSLKTKSSHSFFYVLRQVFLAHDRYKLIQKQWYKTSDGEIVICDRYKSENLGVMDSKRLNPDNYKGIKKKLALLENYFYEIMPIPDVLIYLTVDVEIAVKRNDLRIKEGKEDEVFLRARHEENKNLDYLAKTLYKVDTDNNYEEVIRDIKTKIWNLL